MQSLARGRINAASQHGTRFQRHAFRACRSVQARPAFTGSQSRKSLVTLNAAGMLKDQSSGAEWHVGQKFWIGEEMRCLGAGTRAKQVLFFNAKVYSIALYVEGDKAAKELGIRHRGGFFETDDDYMQAILDGACSKALVIRLLRDIDGATFSQAISESLQPRMALTGDLASLSKFVEFFDAKELANGTEIALLWPITNDLEVSLQPATVDHYDKMQPDLSIDSNTMSRALFELYLGSNTVVPGARSDWVQGTKNLLEYDQVKRNTKKQV